MMRFIVAPRLNSNWYALQFSYCWDSASCHHLHRLWVSLKCLLLTSFPPNICLSILCSVYIKSFYLIFFQNYNSTGRSNFSTSIQSSVYEDKENCIHTSNHEDESVSFDASMVTFLIEICFRIFNQKFFAK